jgi:outer membrane lipoprotein carrier protein
MNVARQTTLLLLAAAPLVLPGAVAARGTGGTPRPRAAQTPASTLDRAAKSFKAAKTVRATFDQTLKNPLTGTEVKATGELLLDQPDRVAVNFTRPAGDRVVSDGRWLWVYLPSSSPNQVLKLSAKGKGMVGVDIVGELLTSPKAKYEIADGGAAQVGGRATRAVVMTPKADGGAISKATVWIDDANAALRQFEVTDANGLVRTVRITGWTANAAVPASAFRFDVPAGVRVLDEAAMARMR